MNKKQFDGKKKQQFIYNNQQYNENKDDDCRTILRNMAFFQIKRIPKKVFKHQ